ncbi:hypothetical protein [Mammaliicoccus sciuri]|uniref:hypothetical protein n=1 Tax=Mammaliicoccus sciuri TaxID=1296 RepID=UPI002DB7FD09|nr:hypothetical protein [Mammaliicoccus sciuri]MEB7784207.1 hypothetical protein [Mammaliicoccus sciuri]
MPGFNIKEIDEHLLYELKKGAKEKNTSTHELIKRILNDYIEDKQFGKTERAFMTRLSQHDKLLIETNQNILFILEHVSSFTEKLEMVMDLPLDEVEVNHHD